MQTVSALDFSNNLSELEFITLAAAFLVAVIIAFIHFREVKAKDVKISSAQKKVSLGIIVIAVILIITVVITGFQYQSVLGDSILYQFNRQQLILARQTALCIENFVLHKLSYLEIASNSIMISSQNEVVGGEHILFVYESHKNDVDNIFVLNSTGYLIFIHPKNMQNITCKDFSFRKYFRECRRTGKPYVSEVLLADGENYADVGNNYRSVVVAVPVFNSSNGFDGVLAVTISISELNKRFIYPVVSGDTGYAWLLDDKSFFLAHYNRDFEGEDAFLVRQRTASEIDFQAINDIMREKMMNGEEGVGWYTSGWHRNRTGEIKKIIAYAPVNLGNRVWSVAVVVPTEEVTGTVNNFYIQQQYITIAIIAVIFIATIGMAIMTLKYNELLENDVKNRTRELEMVNKDLKEEREKTEKAYDQLKEADRMKDEFMNVAAHELKTPLVPIKGYLGIMEDDILSEGDKDTKKIMEVISRNIKRLENLINDILDISKLESGGMKFSMERLDVGEVIENSVQDMASFAYQKGLVIESQISEGLPPVNGDKQRLTQVITNLINNAIKFTEEGSIRVTAEERDNEVVVSVKDEGIGIPGDKISNLFTKFYQVDSTLSRRYGGTGLGLAICKGIVRYHGGRIWVESSEGKGSRFSFTLPLEGKEYKRILYAEDDEDTRELARALFEEGGYNVLTVSTGKECFRLLRREDYDMLLLNSMLPDMSGWELFMKIKKHIGSASSMAVVFLSMIPAEENQIKVLRENGISDYITKPIDPRELLEKINTIFGEKKWGD